MITGRDLQLVQSPAAQLAACTPFRSLPPLPGSRCATPGAEPALLVPHAQGRACRDPALLKEQALQNLFQAELISAAYSEGPKLEVHGIMSQNSLVNPNATSGTKPQ